MDGSSLSMIRGDSRIDSREDPLSRSSHIGSQTLQLLSDEEDQSEYTQMRSSQAANFNELLSRMQALSVNLESQTQQTLSCEEPHVVSSHRLEP